jgi:hypothetical protein
VKKFALLLTALCLLYAGLLTVQRGHSAPSMMTLLGVGATPPGGFSGSCSQSTSFVNRTSGMNTAHQNAFDTLICNLVTDGVWAQLDALYVFATNTQANALLSLVSSTYNATTNGSPQFNADAGFTGVDSSTSVDVDTGFNPNTATVGGCSGVPCFVLNSGHISAWSNTNTTSGVSGGVMMGAGSTGTAAHFFPKYSGGSGSFELNDLTAISVAVANSTGHFVNNRTGASAVQAYRNASSIVTGTTASVSLPAATVAVLADHSAVTGIQFGAANQVMAASIGGGLASGDVTHLCHELNTYLNTIAGVSSGLC